MIRSIAIAACLLLAGVADAAERVALVVGVGAYRSAPALRTPINDAKAISTELRRLGFDVATLTDPSLRALRRGVSRFARSAAQAELAIFYFAGYGLQVDGRNYLAPADATLLQQADVPTETFGLDQLVRVLAASPAAKVIFLDAARTNPLRLGQGATVRARDRHQYVDLVGDDLYRIISWSNAEC